jgi:hypothetical protein
VGDEVLRHHVLVAAPGRVHEEGVPPVDRHDQELRRRPALAQPREDRREAAPLPEARPLEEAVQRVDDRVLPAA